MQFRMANNPRLAAKVNRDTIPVVINLTDQGFPDGLPALDYWRDLHARDVWSHFAFAVFFLLDPEAEESFGFYGCNCAEHLRVAKFRLDTIYADLEDQFDLYLGRYRKVRALSASGENDAEARGELAGVRAELARELEGRRQCADDRRLFTARVLLGRGPAPWSRIVKALEYPQPGESDHLEAGVREAAIRTLADFITNDAPFAAEAMEHVEAIYEKLDPEERRATIARVRQRQALRGRAFQLTDLPVPHSLRVQAARALATITQQAWDGGEEMWVAQVRRWWQLHGHNYAYEPALAPVAAAPAMGEELR